MNLVHRSIVALACLFWVGLAAAQPVAAPRELDRVIAVVNSDVVTASELNTRLRSVERQLLRQRIQAPPQEVLREQVLERLIMDRALVQLAREQGLRIDDAQIEQAVGRIAQENRVTPAQLRAQIQADGVSYPRFLEDLREEMLIARLREREVDARIQISEADVDAFLAEHREGAGGQTEIEVAQILLRVPEGASADQIERQRLRGEEVIRQARSGAEFARLAAAFSDAPDAMSGGVMSARTADRLPELFAKAVTDLQPGEVSPLLRSANGFHVLKLLARRSAGPVDLQGAPVTQTRARHILIRPTELVPEPEVLRRLREIRSRLGSDTAEFAELARQYSIDGSASRGGDLGWIYPGDTVPEFERAMNALQPGQLSEPVRTEFGYHLIEVLERRTDAASPERVRAVARQALRERRIEETLQDWLRQVRDRTYVEYRDL